MGDVGTILGALLLITLLAVFVRLQRSRVRVMAYHHIRTPPVVPPSHGGGGC